MKQISKPIVAGTACGICCGVVLSAYGYFSGAHLCPFFTEGWPTYVKVWASINYPSILFVRLWVFHLHLPPQGEIGAWVVVPLISVLLQWTLMGLLTGAAMSYWKKRGKDRGVTFIN